MSRDLPTGMAIELDGVLLYPAMMVEFELDSGISRMWTGVGTKKIDGKEWYGVGDLASISAIEETLELKAAGISISLSGVSSEWLSVALSEPYQGRTVNIYYCLFDENWKQKMDSYFLWSGELDVFSIDEGEKTSVITVTAESILIDLELPRVRRYTDADQQSEYPGDKGLEFITAIQDNEVQWGS